MDYTLQTIPEQVAGTGGVDTQAGALVSCMPRSDVEHFWSSTIGYSLDAPQLLPAGACFFNQFATGPKQGFTFRG